MNNKNEVRVVFYRDKSGKWRWRTVRSGHITADSGQGYTRKFDAIQAFLRFFSSLRDIEENGKLTDMIMDA